MGEQSKATREGPHSKFEVTWVPHDTLSTTAFVTFETCSTVGVDDDEDAIVLNAFTEALSDLIEAFCTEVGSEIAVVKSNLLRKLQSVGGHTSEWAERSAHCPHEFSDPYGDGAYCLLCGTAGVMA